MSQSKRRQDESLDSDTTCTICQDHIASTAQSTQLQNTVMLQPCKHLYHVRCWSQYCNRSKDLPIIKCTTCRQDVMNDHHEEIPSADPLRLLTENQREEQDHAEQLRLYQGATDDDMSDSGDDDSSIVEDSADSVDDNDPDYNQPEAHRLISAPLSDLRLRSRQLLVVPIDVEHNVERVVYESETAPAVEINGNLKGSPAENLCIHGGA